MSIRCIRLSQIATGKGSPGMVPNSGSAIWRWVRSGMFPKPFKIGGNTTVWDADEVEAWICDQKAGKPSAIASPPPAGRNPVKISTRPNAIRPGRPRKVIE